MLKVLQMHCDAVMTRKVAQFEFCVKRPLYKQPACPYIAHPLVNRIRIVISHFAAGGLSGLKSDSHNASHCSRHFKPGLRGEAKVLCGLKHSSKGDE